MTTRLGVRLLAVTLAAIAVLAPTTAHAEKVVTEDAVGDVLALAESVEDVGQMLPAPDYAGVDIVRTTVDHGAARLRMSVRFRALERDPFQFTVIWVGTPQGNYEIVVERLGGTPIASMERGRKTVECRGLKAKVDLRADTVTTRLPTSCLGTPRWVQVGVGAVAVGGDQSSPELIAAYADDAHREGEVRENIAKGPRIHRG